MATDGATIRRRPARRLAEGLAKVEAGAVQVDTDAIPEGE